MANSHDSDDTRALHPEQCEHPASPECCEDAPFGLFDVGELDVTVKLIADADQGDWSEETLRRKQHESSELATARCYTLDGIAAKVELALCDRISDFDFDLDRTRNDFGIWRTIEIMALATSVLDLHRLRRIGAEARP